MTAKGHVENGVVVLDPPAAFLEGAEVEVHMLRDATQPGPNPPLQRPGDDTKYAHLHPYVREMIGILPKDFDWEREAHIWEKYGVE